MNLRLPTVGFLSLVILNACAAFWVERGPVVVPSRTLAPPETRVWDVRSDPRAEVERWTRSTRVGLGGYVDAVLWDPTAAQSQLAYEIALNHLGRAAASDLSTQRWSTLYGAERDRFPIDLRWRFDEQFIASRRILDPGTWRFELQLATGGPLSPHSVAVLKSSVSAQDGFWNGEVRLWFPWRDPVRHQLVLGGENPWVRLVMSHFSGNGEVTWRFPGAW
ncbi:MAG: hypothetical protein VKN33_10505 [Candidatus Sericytochromatia bacterium]|nr:hypothetical protein [Candidatus Sericytochromatia bacterium]